MTKKAPAKAEPTKLKKTRRKGRSIIGKQKYEKKSASSSKKTAKRKNKLGAGRPPIYDEIRHPMLARALARQGMIEDEIAVALNIGRATISRWKLKHPEFRDAMRQGKDPINREVEGELLTNCRTRQVVKTIEETRPDPNDPKKTIKIKRIESHEEAGKVTAQKFFLINREPRNWRNQQDVYINDDRDLETIPDEQLDKDIDRYGKIVGKDGVPPETEGKGKA